MSRATSAAAKGSKARASRRGRIESHGGETAGSEQRVARLTILIDPTKKRIFEEICAAQDLTPSQVVRRLIRQYVVENAAGRPLPEWLAGAEHRSVEQKKAAPAKAK